MTTRTQAWIAAGLLVLGGALGWGAKTWDGHRRAAPALAQAAGVETRAQEVLDKGAAAGKAARAQAVVVAQAHGQTVLADHAVRLAQDRLDQVTAAGQDLVPALRELVTAQVGDLAALRRELAETQTQLAMAQEEAKFNLQAAEARGEEVDILRTALKAAGDGPRHWGAGAVYDPRTGSWGVTGEYTWTRLPVRAGVDLVRQVATITGASTLDARVRVVITF